MRCKNCGQDIPDGVAFCGGCGAATGAGQAPFPAGEKCCPNGHKYDASLLECPWCPKGDRAFGPTHRAAPPQQPSKRKTAIEGMGGSLPPATGGLGNATPSSAGLANGGVAPPLPGKGQPPRPPSTDSPRKNKTVIQSPSDNPFARRSSGKPSASASKSKGPALRGWLVVLNSQHHTPYEEFRVYEGANPIGIANGTATLPPIALKEPGLAKHHATLTNAKRDFVLEVHGGQIGTRLNGHSIKKAQLPPGSMLTIGSTTMVFVPFLCSAG